MGCSLQLQPLLPAASIVQLPLSHFVPHQATPIPKVYFRNLNKNIQPNINHESIFRCWCLKAIYFQFQCQESPVKTHRGRLAIFGWRWFLEHKFFFCLTGRNSVSLTQLMPEPLDGGNTTLVDREDGQVCPSWAGTDTSSSPEGRQSQLTPTLHPELLCQIHPSSAAGQENNPSQAGSQ